MVLSNGNLHLFLYCGIWTRYVSYYIEKKHFSKTNVILRCMWTALYPLAARQPKNKRRVRISWLKYIITIPTFLHLRHFFIDFIA